MKISIINTPNRNIPTTYPPVGVLSIMNYLRNHEFSEIDFINIDYYRYEMEETVKSIINSKLDILGISAVTSTSYAFVKELSLKIKSMNKDIVIVLGGNMAASAEIILRKTGVDFCVLGEGEKVFLNLVRRVSKTKVHSEFKDILGLMFIDEESNQLINTGYGELLKAEELYDIDWDDLKETTDYYISDVFDSDGNLQLGMWKYDSRTYEPHRRKKKYFSLIVGKGCVAKCTFCHRWDKGIQHIPVKILMNRLDFMIKKYNIGFLSPQIEAFATDKKWLSEFCREIKKRDILWKASAVRAKSVTPEIIEEMKESGCVSILYGLETGSEKMLTIMEKKTSMQENYNAQKWTIEAGFYSTVVNLVIGMPGENEETIDDTLKFTQYSYTLNKNSNPTMLSINYVQALPGTPLYEYGRRVGIIGGGIDDEEKYLISVSDKNAGDLNVIANFTDYPILILMSWKYIILYGAVSAYVEKYGFKQLVSVVSKQSSFNNKLQTFDNKSKIPLLSLFKSGLPGNISTKKLYLYVILFRFRMFLPFIIAIKDAKLLGGYKKTLGFVFELLKFYITSYNRPKGNVKNESIKFDKSLRKIVNNEIAELPNDTVQMRPLRKGR